VYSSLNEGGLNKHLKNYLFELEVLVNRDILDLINTSDILIVMKTITLSLLIVLFTACSPKAPGVKPPFVINPYEFYERFNLRTIISSYSGYVEHYCATYPKDFFRPDQLYMPNMETLVIENEQRRLIFELYEEDRVIVTEESKDGTYRAKYLYKIYYNEEHDDFRTDRFYIPKKEDCLEYKIPLDVS